MFVTVLLPVYNAGKFLCPTLDRILNQSLQDFELLILDDASTDESWEIVSSYQDDRIRAVKNEWNIGLAATLNRGLAMASGELIARQDQDDLSQRDRLKKQVEVFEGYKQAAAVFSRARLIDAEDRLIGWVRTPTNVEAIRWDLCFRNGFVHGTAMFRRDIIWGKLGGYHPLPACEDYDLWSRLLREQGEIVVLAENLIDYRIHPSSMMGQEHREAFAKSQEALRGIMEKNCRVFLGLSDRQIEVLVSAWLEPQTANWTSFFAIQKDKLHSHQRSNFREIKKILAEEDFSLYRRCRQIQCAASFLRALYLVAPLRFVALPWLRILGEWLLATLGWRFPR